MGAMNKVKILVVEDNTQDRSLYQLELTALGYEVWEAENGTQCFEKLKEGLPNLILLDIILPDTSGLDILAQLKKDANTKSIPVICFTNLSQEDTQRRIIELGGTDYLSKTDYTPAEMAQVVKRVLEEEGIIKASESAE